MSMRKIPKAVVEGFQITADVVGVSLKDRHCAVHWGANELLGLAGDALLGILARRVCAETLHTRRLLTTLSTVGEDTTIVNGIKVPVSIS